MPDATLTSSTNDTRASVIAAAADLLDSGGTAAVTTRAVAAAAGVSAPMIFRMFGDKEGLLDAVAEHVLTTYVASKPTHADLDPVAALREGWDRHLEFGLEHPHVVARLSVPRAQPSAAAQAGMLALRERILRLAAAGLLIGSVDRAMAAIHAAGTGVMLALISQPPDQRDLAAADLVFESLTARLVATEPGPSTADLSVLVSTFAESVPDLPSLSAAERDLLGDWLARVQSAVDG